MVEKRAQIELRKQELQAALLKEKHLGLRRMKRAFPEIHHTRYGEALQGIKKKLPDECHMKLE